MADDVSAGLTGMPTSANDSDSDGPSQADEAQVPKPHSFTQQVYQGLWRLGQPDSPVATTRLVCAEDRSQLLSRVMPLVPDHAVLRLERILQTLIDRGAVQVVYEYPSPQGSLLLRCCVDPETGETLPFLHPRTRIGKFILDRTLAHLRSTAYDNESDRLARILSAKAKQAKRAGEQIPKEVLRIVRGEISPADMGLVERNRPLPVTLGQLYTWRAAGSKDRGLQQVDMQYTRREAAVAALHELHRHGFLRFDGPRTDPYDRILMLSEGIDETSEEAYMFGSTTFRQEKHGRAQSLEMSEGGELERFCEAIIDAKTGVEEDGAREQDLVRREREARQIQDPVKRAMALEALAEERDADDTKQGIEPLEYVNLRELNALRKPREDGMLETIDEMLERLDLAAGLPPDIDMRRQRRSFAAKLSQLVATDVADPLEADADQEFVEANERIHRIEKLRAAKKRAEQRAIEALGNQERPEETEEAMEPAVLLVAASDPVPEPLTPTLLAPLVVPTAETEEVLTRRETVMSRTAEDQALQSAFPACAAERATPRLTREALEVVRQYREFRPSASGSEILSDLIMRHLGPEVERLRSLAPPLAPVVPAPKPAMVAKPREFTVPDQVLSRLAGHLTRKGYIDNPVPFTQQLLRELRRDRVDREAALEILHELLKAQRLECTQLKADGAPDWRFLKPSQTTR